MEHLKELTQQIASAQTVEHPAAENASVRSSADFDSILNEFCKNGYKITDHNRDALSQVIQYMNRSPKFVGDLRKGLCICGSKGTGKSILLKAMNRAFLRIEDQSGQRQESFLVDNIVSLAGYYQQKGDTIFNDLRTPFLKDRRNHRMCNDIGREVTETLFMGNREDVGARYIYERYELFQNSRIKTHFTTNYTSADQFQKRYGDLNYDRMIEMCNFIFIDGPSWRG